MKNADLPDSDDAEVALARAGDPGALARLVDKYQARVYRLALRIVGQREDAEEVAQQTFLNLVKHLPDFRGDSSFHTWLMRIATNQGLSVLRRRARRSPVAWTDHRQSGEARDVPFSELVARWRETPEEIASHQELRQLLTETLDELDLKYSMVFVLRDLEGLSTRETGKALDIQPGAVKVRLLRARRMLRGRLAERFGDDVARIIPMDDSL